MSLINTLPVGATCVYYIHGDVNLENAAPAVVLKAYKSGILELKVFSQGADSYRDCVRHVDDPEVKSRPEATRREGCWDFVRHTANGQPPLSQEDSERAVTEALRNGMSPELIVDNLKVPLKMVDSIAKKIKV